MKNFSRGGLRSPWKIYLLCITLVLFAGSTLFFAMDMADTIERFKIILMDNSSFDIFQARMDLAEVKTTPLTWTEEMLFVFMVCLAHLQCVIVLMLRFEADLR